MPVWFPSVVTLPGLLHRSLEPTQKREIHTVRVLLEVLAQSLQRGVLLVRLGSVSVREFTLGGRPVGCCVPDRQADGNAVDGRLDVEC